MKTIHCSGKRKSAIARATLKEGKGIVKVNNKMLDIIYPEMLRLKIQEPLLLIADVANKYDIDIHVSGGGVNSQAEAARLAVARCLVNASKKFEKLFLNYDRHLLVADVRRKEASKPNRHGQARAKRQKSYR